MVSPSHTAKDGIYEEFCAGYDPATKRFDASAGGLGFLGQAVVNKDPWARLAIANSLLDDGAPSLVSVDMRCGVARGIVTPKRKRL